MLNTLLKLIGWIFLLVGVVAIMFSPVIYGVVVGTSLLVLGGVMVTDWK
jgi:hypothetical protein